MNFFQPPLFPSRMCSSPSILGSDLVLNSSWEIGTNRGVSGAALLNIRSHGVRVRYTNVNQKIIHVNGVD